MSRVVLSTAARLDRREITAYTVRRFGIRSARQVRDRFQTALNALAASPHCHSHPHGSTRRCSEPTRPL